ncbi:uncharacterized protein LOC132697153 [Cylas formicarius]|uniref:uncharacterized protein LOC132697153 n=1 Tax=Cylas formicarius TaxID=197179 RepID=UPI0029588EC3|nr:uncharacterized protein LOC132697153 [Cylas formicarius]
MVEFFDSNLLEVFSLHVALKTAKITKPPAPWLTENFQIMIKLKHKALYKYKKQKTEQSWIEYKELRSLINIAVKSEKKAFLQHKFLTDPKNFWRVLRYLNVYSGPSVNTDVSNIADANELNQYFYNDTRQTDLNNHFINQFYNNNPSNPEKLSFSSVNSNEVGIIIQQIRTHAVGPDGIDRKIILYVIPQLLPHITYIINKCLSTNKFPKSWKYANVIPVPKTSQPLYVSQFRPTSILPTISKVLEKVGEKQLGDFTARHNILPPTQSGFGAHYGTNMALLKVCDDIIRANDVGLNTCLILLDYSKAFDTLDHGLLLAKLKYYGVEARALQFFKSYFSDRCQINTAVININSDLVLSMIFLVSSTVCYLTKVRRNS